MESRLFTELAANDVQTILTYMAKTEYPEGAFIFRENETGEKMFLIDKGEVEVFVERSGKHITIAKLSSGDFFGEMGILRNNTRSANIIATENIALYELSREGLMEIISKEGILAARFLLNISEVLAERIASTNKEVENWFLINDALVENEQFRNLYFKTHRK